MVRIQNMAIITNNQKFLHKTFCRDLYESRVVVRKQESSRQTAIKQFNVQVKIIYGCNLKFLLAKSKK